MNHSLKAAFERAATHNYWAGEDSVSGPGSNMTQTAVIRREIPKLVQKYKVKKMLDAPCGDLFWMKEIIPQLVDSGVEYFGADIVPALIERHRATFQHPQLRFGVLDITTSPLPKMDLILTRDCFIHLSFTNIYAVLSNYKKSGSSYLLVSTYTNPSRKNKDVQGFYLYGRMLNLQKFPFFFKKPMELVVEGCTEGDGVEYSDKSLGLWKLSELNLFKMRCCIFLSAVLSFFFNNKLKDK